MAANQYSKPKTPSSIDDLSFQEDRLVYAGYPHWIENQSQYENIMSRLLPSYDKLDDFNCLIACDGLLSSLQRPMIEQLACLQTIRKRLTQKHEIEFINVIK